MAQKAKIEITLGDLIAALSEETRQHVRDERAVYEVVAYIVAGLLSGESRCRRGLPSPTVPTFAAGARPPSYRKTPVSEH